MQIIRTKNAPTPGPYNQGIMVDSLTHKLLFMAGQTGNDPRDEDEAVAKGGLGPQTTQALENMLAIIEEAGGCIHSLVSVDVFLRDDEDGDPERRKEARLVFNGAYMAFFKAHGLTSETQLPVRMQVWVPEVPWECPTEDTVIEIRGIAAIPR